MRRIFRLRVLLVIVLAAAIGAAVAVAMSQKQKFQAMSPDERREFLGDKLSGRMPDEQIDEIAAKITAKLDGVSTAAEEAIDDGEVDVPAVT